MSDYKPGEIIGVSSVMRTPTAHINGKYHVLFVRPRISNFRIFIMQGLGTPGRVAAKSIALN